MTYCSKRGLSSPYLASIAFLTDSETAFSPTKGPPGTACITKKVTVMTSHTVTIASSSLFRMYTKVFVLI